MSPEELRQQYGPHERRVRAVALVYWYGAALYVTAAAVGPIVLAGFARSSESGAYGLDATLTLVAASLALAGIAAVTAWNLAQLNATGRVLGAIGGCFMLFGLPVGTLMGILVLWTLLGKQGAVVFSPEYADAVAATPHLQFRVSRFVIALLVFFFAIMIVMTLVALID